MRAPALTTALLMGCNLRNHCIAPARGTTRQKLNGNSCIYPKRSLCAITGAGVRSGWRRGGGRAASQPLPAWSSVWPNEDQPGDSSSSWTAGYPNPNTLAEQWSSPGAFSANTALLTHAEAGQVPDSNSPSDMGPPV